MRGTCPLASSPASYRTAPFHLTARLCLSPQPAGLNTQAVSPGHPPPSVPQQTTPYHQPRQASPCTHTCPQRGRCPAENHTSPLPRTNIPHVCTHRDETAPNAQLSAPRMLRVNPAPHPPMQSPRQTGLAEEPGRPRMEMTPPAPQNDPAPPVMFPFPHTRSAGTADISVAETSSDASLRPGSRRAPGSGRSWLRPAMRQRGLTAARVLPKSTVGCPQNSHRVKRQSRSGIQPRDSQAGDGSILRPTQFIDTLQHLVNRTIHVTHIIRVPDQRPQYGSLDLWNPWFGIAISQRALQGKRIVEHRSIFDICRLILIQISQHLPGSRQQMAQFTIFNAGQGTEHCGLNIAVVERQPRRMGRGTWHRQGTHH